MWRLEEEDPKDVFFFLSIKFSFRFKHASFYRVFRTYNSLLNLWNVAKINYNYM